MGTKGVRILQGDPKKAIRKLAVPMMFGMPVIFFTNVAAGILRGEGDMKRTICYIYIRTWKLNASKCYSPFDVYLYDVLQQVLR